MGSSKNHGGSRVGSGRKKGSGISGKIKKHVDNMMNEMLKDPELKSEIIKDVKQLSINSGWVYVIQDNINKNIKVGVTQRENPRQRLNHYASHRMDIKLLFIDCVDDCYEIEEDVHSMLSDFNVSGDWFSLCSNQIIETITYINKYKYTKYYNGRW